MFGGQNGSVQIVLRTEQCSAEYVETKTMLCRIFGDHNSTMKIIWITETGQCRMFGEHNSTVQNVLITEQCSA